MALSISGKHREQFRKDLLADRAAYELTDAEYATDQLKISTNTYKKCVLPNPVDPLRLSRQTLARILRNAKLVASDYGVSLPLPELGSPFGGYTKEEFGFLAGRSLIYRRSFLTGRNFNKSVVDISWNDRLGCLSFDEILHYVADRGAPQKLRYHGEIYMHRDRMLMSLLAMEAGEVRLTLLHAPTRPAPGKPRPPFRLRGIQLAHAYPRGFFQPAATPVLLEEMPKLKGQPIERICGTIKESDKEYQRIATELEHTEQESTIFTPLLGIKGRAIG
jgi:hypothetical protein